MKKTRTGMFDGEEYEVEYETDSVPIQFTVRHSNSLTIEAVLNHARVFHIPESQEKDDYREDMKRPVDGLTYFELALNTLQSDLTDILFMIDVLGLEPLEYPPGGEQR